MKENYINNEVQIVTTANNDEYRGKYVPAGSFHLLSLIVGVWLGIFITVLVLKFAP